MFDCYACRIYRLDCILLYYGCELGMETLELDIWID